MSKILRKSAKLFGSTAGPTQIGQFGSLAAASPAYSTDPATIQALTNWLGGWFSAVVGSNSPAIEDMNGFCYVMAYQIAYLMQAGIQEYDTGTTYYIGSLANSSGVVYVSLTDNNTNNTVTDGVNWAVFGGKTRTVTTTASATVADDIVRANTTSAGFTITLPAVATSLGKKITIVNVGTSAANKVTVAGNGSENIWSANTYDLNSLESAVFFCNGSSWDVL